MSNRKYDPNENVVSIKSLKDKSPKRTLLYHALDTATGDYCDEFAIELLFNSKDNAVGFLKKHKLNYVEVADAETLPY